jgi:hypothetical protein
MKSQLLKRPNDNLFHFHRFYSTSGENYKNIGKSDVYELSSVDPSYIFLDINYLQGNVTSFVINNAVKYKPVKKDSELAQIEKCVKIDNENKKERIIEFLEKYEELSAYIIAACDKIKLAFKYNVSLNLDLYQDPEINDIYLVLYVKSNPWNDEKERKIDDIFENICDTVNKNKWIFSIYPYYLKD